MGRIGRKSSADKRTRDRRTPAGSKAKASAVKTRTEKRGAAQRKAARVQTADDGTGKPIRIVGIGASAGGLEALELFFDGMVADSGLAFVVVQHLSPDFRSMMDELLARHSKMRIRHALDGMTLERNTIYLNPPRHNLLVADGRLRLRPADDEQVPNLPIDALFMSLAREEGAKAIGVVLSGTGSDGTRGAVAIKHSGGCVIVQDPESAKFENMPRSAIDRGVASIIDQPVRMGLHIAGLVSGSPVVDDKVGSRPIEPEDDILRQLEKRFGANFAYYKKSTVGRRLRRRASLNGLQDLSNYADVLRRNPEELEHLYADLLIGVTAFFRDKSGYNSLAKHALPRLAAQMAPDRQVRVWVAGCASGEEPYSIAMLFSEFARENDLPLNLKIFATDLHYGSLEKAGLGIYTAESLAEMPSALRERYFEPVGERFQVKPSLRRLVVFSPHNLIKDPPFNNLDLVTCRNLLIYLDDTAQRKVLSMFHFALIKDGILFLGPSETAGTLQDEFETLDTRWRIFRKLRDLHLPETSRMLPSVAASSIGLPHDHVPELSSPARNLASPQRATRADRRDLLRAYDSLLARYAPASLLISRDGELMHVFGNAVRFLCHKPGVFSTRLTDLIIDPLKLAVTSALEASLAKRSQPFAREVSISDEGGKAKLIEVTAERLEGPGLGYDTVLITLAEREDAAPAPEEQSLQRMEERAAQQARIEALERNLRFTEESLQTTIEELETSNEELQSTNEELMSANEELQSTNEELHAVNEELYSVSTEHQRKIEELMAITADMDHLLRCTDVGTIFLDQDLKVRRFTPAIAKTFNLLDRDIGRPIDHITARFSYPGLSADVAKVAAAGDVIEQAINHEDASLLLRIFPFKVEGRTRGIVITLIDVSSLKQAERALEVRNTELARLNSSLEQFTYIVSHDLRAPLRTILNSAKWILEDLGDTASEEVRGHAQRLMTYAARLTDMLTDLLEYARLGNADATSVETVDLDDMLRSVADSLDVEGRLDLVCESSLAEFACHRAPLLQVFQNLLDNALKYSDKPRAAVHVLAEDLGSHLRFSVSDNGPGIPPRHHEKVFLPFRKLEHAQDKPGTGMGLALVKKAVQDNGGKIEVVSQPDQGSGTMFRFTWAKISKATD